ncbi:MAG: MFS transporter [Gaiellales bacterium]
MFTPPRTAIRRLATGRAVSFTGSEATWIALMVAIYASTHSTVWMSATLFVTIGASGLFTPIAGALGDRYDRRIVMVASDLAASAVAVALALAHAPALLVVLAFAGAVAQSPFFSASTAAIPNLVEATDVAWANSTIALGRSAGSLIGPVLGGVLAGLVNPSAVFLVNAVCFAGSAALVWSVRGRFADPQREDAHEHRGLRAGATFIAREPVLRLMLAAWVVLLLLLGPVLVAELPLAHSFGVGSAGYGLLVACWGGGGIAGAVLARRLVRQHERWTMIGGTMVIGAGFGLVALAPVFELALIGMLAAGCAEGAVSVAEQGILQRRTPDAVRSRATAVTEAGMLAAFALSFPPAGFLIQLIGVRGVYAMAAIGGLLAGAVLVPAMRRLADAPGPYVTQVQPVSDTVTKS